MLTILQNTPIRVYLIFLLVVCFGIKAFSPRRESRASMLITPPAFLAWSLYSLNLTINPTLFFCIWLGALSLGGLSAWLVFSRRGVALDDSATGLIMPGTAKILIMYLMFFFANYYFNYQHDVHPERSASPDMLLLKAGITGFMCGLISTRSLKLYWTLRALCARKLPVVAQ
ncbi:hypothetical protein CFN16_22480 [Pseudomonas fluorescens]|uniref:DUF1453 domain-containing protein n=1 Tax=Pseudomonas fluorescens TaxID=294 RepID=A0A345V244_PSEFL|nr:hypothetical protein [Pseudomonas fluorescens]AXJ06796.1 hypothetical protein CFN16_22480 [Pseudomonas fluorescens]WJK08885.1 hypothetical protein QR290_24150 [Pseudomonas fluorescens]